MTSLVATATESIVSLLMDELRQSLEPKIQNALADYNLYKETHEAVMKIPFVKRLLENQCRCSNVSQTQSTQLQEPIQLEIIDTAVEHAEQGLQNLDSINEYINSTKFDYNNDANIATSSSDFECASEEVDADSVANESDADNDEEERHDVAHAEVEKEGDEVDEDGDEVDEEGDEEDEDEKEDEEEEEEEDEEEEEGEGEGDEEGEGDKEKEEGNKEKKERDEERDEEGNEEEIQVSHAEEKEASKEASKEEEEEDDEEEDEEEEEEDEEELELFEVEIKGKTYVTNDEKEGDIYDYTNDEVGEIVGAFKNGIAKFAKKSRTKSS